MLLFPGSPLQPTSCGTRAAPAGSWLRLAPFVGGMTSELPSQSHTRGPVKRLSKGGALSPELPLGRHSADRSLKLRVYSLGGSRTPQPGTPHILTGLPGEAKHSPRSGKLEQVSQLEKWVRHPSTQPIEAWGWGIHPAYLVIRARTMWGCPTQTGGHSTLGNRYQQVT